MNEMNEKLMRRLLRQIKILNFFLVFFSLVFIALLLTVGFFANKALQEVRDAKSSLDTVQTQAGDVLNVQDEVCASDSAAAAAVRDRTDFCN